MSEQFKVRIGGVDDLSFVYATWLRNYFSSSHFARRISPKVFFAEHHRVIERILERGTTALYVAHPPDDPGVILGYLVAESGPTIHFAYTKAAFRSLGIQRELLKAAGLNPNDCQFTHWTHDADGLTSKWGRATYNPYAVGT